MAPRAVITRIAIMAIVPVERPDSFGAVWVLSVKTSLRWPGVLTTTCFCTVSSLVSIKFLLFDVTRLWKSAAYQVLRVISLKSACEYSTAERIRGLCANTQKRRPTRSPRVSKGLITARGLNVDKAEPSLTVGLLPGRAKRRGPESHSPF